MKTIIELNKFPIYSSTIHSSRKKRFNIIILSTLKKTLICVCEVWTLIQNVGVVH
jgi:hypothetical protein